MATAEAVVEEILKRPGDLERIQRILEKFSGPFLGQVLLLLRSKVASILAKGGPVTLIIGAWALWNYLGLAAIQAAFETKTGPIRSARVWRQILQALANFLDILEDVLKECELLGADKEALEKARKCLQRALSKYRNGYEKVADKFDAKYKGKPVPEGTDGVIQELIPAIRDLWRIYMRDVLKCLEELGCPDPTPLKDAMQAILDWLSDGFAIQVMGVPPKVGVGVNLSAVSKRIRTGVHAKGGFSWDETPKDDSDEPEIDSNTRLTYFNKKQLQLRTKVIRKKIREVQKIMQDIRKALQEARNSGDRTDVEVQLRALEVNEKFLVFLTEALRKTLLACLTRSGSATTEYRTAESQLRTLEYDVSQLASDDDQTAFLEIKSAFEPPLQDSFDNQAINRMAALFALIRPNQTDQDDVDALIGIGTIGDSISGRRITRLDLEDLDDSFITRRLPPIDGNT